MNCLQYAHNEGLALSWKTAAAGFIVGSTIAVLNPEMISDVAQLTYPLVGHIGGTFFGYFGGTLYGLTKWAFSIQNQQNPNSIRYGEYNIQRLLICTVAFTILNLKFLNNIKIITINKERAEIQNKMAQIYEKAEKMRGNPDQLKEIVHEIAQLVHEISRKHTKLMKPNIEFEYEEIQINETLI